MPKENLDGNLGEGDLSSQSKAVPSITTRPAPAAPNALPAPPSEPHSWDDDPQDTTTTNHNFRYYQR